MRWSLVLSTTGCMVRFFSEPLAYAGLSDWAWHPSASSDLGAIRRLEWASDSLLTVWPEPKYRRRKPPPLGTARREVTESIRIPCPDLKFRQQALNHSTLR